MKHRRAAIVRMGGIVGLILLGMSLLWSSVAKAESSLLFGQDQAYSAVVRSDGTVITYGKIFLDNHDSSDLKETTFYAPRGVSLGNLEVYQVLVPKTCQDIPRNYPQGYDYSITNCTNLEQQAFQFNESGYYYDQSVSQFTYKKLVSKQNGNKYTVTLADPIKPGKQGAYIVAYKTADYTKNTFGLYDLAFKSLPVDQAVDEIHVSIELSSDLQIRGGTSQINPSATNDSSITDGAANTGDGAIRSSSLDRLQSSIGNGGTIEKTGKGLVAQESFVVNGQFADASWKLYIKEIAFALIGIIVFIGLTVFLLRKAGSSKNDKSVTKRGVRHGK